MKKLLTLILVLALFPLPAKAVEEVEPIRVAVIDSGICTKIVPEESVLDGHNYLRPGYDTEDFIGHGTAVAQLILQHAPDAQLVPLTYCDSVYGKVKAVNLDTVCQMVIDAVDVYHCDIINISAATTADYKPLKDAVDYAYEQGVVVVAAAGNHGTDTPNYPASYDTVIGVGALDAEGEISDFTPTTGADVYALGEKLPVSLPNGRKVLVTGTSFACAEITALAVSLLEQSTEQTREELHQQLYLTNGIEERSVATQRIAPSSS